MACFLVPTAEAIVTAFVERGVAKREAKEGVQECSSSKFSWKTKLSWLNAMLWGGAVLLCLEHIWHGEVVLYPPFLTAMADPADAAVMLQEMSTIGVAMALLVTAAWVIMVLVADRMPAIKKALGCKTALTEEA